MGKIIDSENVLEIVVLSFSLVFTVVSFILYFLTKSNYKIYKGYTARQFKMQAIVGIIVMILITLELIYLD